MKVSEEDIKAEKTMLNKHLRINELLHEYSRLFYHILLPCAIVIIHQDQKIQRWL